MEEQHVSDPGDATDVAIVTGGAGAGIGAGISVELAAAGWHVAIVDRDIAAAATVAAALVDEGSCASAHEFDLSASSGHDELLHDIEQHGQCRLLVNSAGIGLTKRVADASLSDWERLMDLDVRGAWLMSRAVLRSMVTAGDGCIINIGSIQALGPAEQYGLYATAKSALAGLTLGIAADYGHAGIRAVCVHPGMVDSPQNREIFASFGDPDAFIANYIETRQMVPRLIQPADIGRAVVFLASRHASAITGTAVVVDAGSSAMAFDRPARESTE